ncbi:MAG: Peptidase M23/M37 [candidate division TM6 bacterium GW2011_GWE2_42_60]|nr:MAG: Peptidase M23/M37 [candidate division TM6 bacterium GW2011_GWE2_42_60]HBY05997.1 hypothetical protein [Candidatus Dependentiae bacterium]
MDVIKKLSKIPLVLVARVTIFGAMLLCVWSFFAYCHARELLDLGLSLSKRRNSHSVVACNQNQAEFNPVNRDKVHLQVIALSLAKKHGHKMEASVRDLYKQTKKLPQKKESKPVKKLVRVKRSCPAFVPAKHTVALKNKNSVVPHTRKIQGKKILQTLAASAVWDPRFSLPIQSGKFRITSPFGWRKIRGRREFHGGVDMAAPKGTPVKAAGAGTVVHAGFIRGFGNLVVIEHDKRTSTFYGHLSVITARLGEVAEGDMIGRVGATGRAYGAHLHFAVKVRGRWVNPCLFLKR